MSEQAYKILLNVIPWIPTIIFALVLLGHILRGAIRGFSKSLKLFITFVISICIALVVFYVLKNNFDTLFANQGDMILANFNTSWKQIFNTETTYTSMVGYIEEYLSNNEQFSEYVANSGLTVAEAAKLIYSVSLTVVNIVLLILCWFVFVISKFILYIIYLIGFREGRRKKKINKKYDMGTVSKPYKKHVFGGILVGAIRGLIVALVLLTPIYTITYLVTLNESSSESTDNVDDSATYYTDIYQAVSKMGTTGVSSLITNAKNSKGIPYYILVSDKLLSSEYTYTDEDGTEQTVTLNLSSDLAPLSSTVCKIAYQFLLYGFDPQKEYTSDELMEFIVSDTEINGYTLEEKIAEILDGFSFNDNSTITYVVNTFVASYVKNYVGSDVDESSLSELSLDKRVLYHLFLGDNSFTVSEIVNGNIDAVYNAFIDVVKNKDQLTTIQEKLSSSSSSNTSTTTESGITNQLVFGISNEASEEDVSDVSDFVTEIKEDLQSLSFYGSEKFNLLFTDVIKDVMSAFVPDFDFTNIDGEDLSESIEWDDSIDALFDFTAEFISVAVDENVTDTQTLMKTYLAGLADNTSEIYTSVVNLVNSSAAVILLNTKGFNSFVDSSISDAVSNALSVDVSLVTTNWATTTDSNGNTVTGELVKIINTFAPTLSSLYDILIEVDSSTGITSEQMTSLIDTLTSTDSGIYELFDISNENHSNFIHSLLSSIIDNMQINYDGSAYDMYVLEDDYSTITLIDNSNVSVISSTAIKNVLDVFNSISDSVYSLVRGESFDAVSFIETNGTKLLSSTLLTANISRVICKLAIKNSITIPESLKLSSLSDDTEDLLDTNITNWTDTTSGEFLKLINAIKSGASIIQSILDGDSETSYIVNIINSTDSFIEAVCDSLLINTNITEKITSLSSDSSFEIKVPYAAYKDSDRTMLNSSEFSSLINYIKTIFNVDDTTEEIDFSSITYANLFEEDAIDLLASSKIMVATVAYYFTNTIAVNETVKKYITIPSVLTDDLDETNDSNIINNYAESLWEDEIVALFENVGLVGLTFSESVANMDIAKVFSLGEAVSDTDSRTKVEVIYESLILKTSISNLLINNEVIYIPDVSLDGEYVAATELASACNSFKTLLGDSLSSDTFSLDNVDSYIDLSTYSANMDTLASIVEPNIVNATIAKLIVDAQDSTSDVIVPTILSFSKDDETYLSNWLYQSSTDCGETIKLLYSINDLGLLASFNSTMSVDTTVLSSLTDEVLEEVTSSIIINATIYNFLISNKSSGIYIPSELETTKDNIISSYSTQAFVTNSETYKFLKGLTRLGSTLDAASFSVSNLKSLNETDSTDTTKTKVEVLLESSILWYSISNYILDLSSTIDISESVKTTNNSETYISEDEISALVSSLTTLDITDFSDITYDTILTTGIDMDTLLSSTIIWYTFTNKLLTVSTIIITEDVIETINTGDTSEYFIDKSELNYFVDAVTLLTTGSLDDVSVDATTVVNNINTIVLSSIVRNIVTDNIISSSNEIVIKDSNSNIYATVNAKYDSTGKTSTYVCQATSSELTYFVEAVKIVLGDSPSSFDIDYSSIDVKTIDSSILYSTIILIGLQSTITTAINVYNVYALSNGLDQFEPTYSSYYLYDSTASDVNYMAKNNNIVNKLEVERLQEAYSAI